MIGYTDTIRRYAVDNRFAGDLPNPDGIGEVGLGEKEAGTRLAVRFCLQISGRVIETVRFQVFGCGYTIAACAAAAELAEGRSLDEVRNYSPTNIDQVLGGLPEERAYCAELAIEALQAAASSADSNKRPVLANLMPYAGHGPLLNSGNPVYRALVNSLPAGEAAEADRQLFAGLLAVADSEPVPLELALNLTPLLLDELLRQVFPGVERRQVFGNPQKKSTAPPEINLGIEELLHSYLPAGNDGLNRFTSLVLAKILAARAAHPGHLWVAMGLFERKELSAAIGRHLPALLAANHQGMRWKRFLFKQVCELNGGRMCKSPVCGDCSDYTFCFATEEE